MSNEIEDLITIEELCEALSIGRNAAYDLLNRKEIKAFRIGRCWKIPKTSVNEYILRKSALKN
jgi:excisionase family DNA binding protein